MRGWIIPHFHELNCVSYYTIYLRATMKQKLTPICVLLGIAVIPFTFTGCLAIVAGGAAAGTVAYVKGDSEVVVNASLVKSKKAADAAVKKLGLLKISEKSDALTAVIVTRNSEDTKITISLESQTEETTKIGVRYGLFGDESQSARVLSEITKRL